jgi:MFS family permease
MGELTVAVAERKQYPAAAGTAGDEALQDAATPEGGMLHSIQAYPAFRMLMLGTLGSSSAFWMYQVAIGWLALELTDSPLFVGLAGFVGGIPLLLCSIPAGVVIDRYDRRIVLLLAQAGVMVVSAVLATLIAIDAIEPWSLLALVALNGTIMTFIFPVRTAMVPGLVERADLANAVALMSATQNATRVFGPSLAGVLIATIGTSSTFAAAAIAQGLALLGIWQLPESRSAPSTASGSRWDNVTLGFRVVAATPVLMALIVLALAPTVLVMPYINLMPVFARDVLGLGATGLGVLLASTGLGTVAGALAVARSSSLRAHPRLQALMAVGWSLGVVAFAFTTHVLVAVPVLFVAGWLSAAFLAINQTALQLEVDDAVRGRVLSIYLLTWGMLPIGQLGVGALADVIGTPIALAASCLLAVACIGLIVRRFARPAPSGRALA